MKMNCKQRGLSLIELMISLVVGLILVAAVFNMYVGNVRSARFTEGMQAIQENGRYGVSVLRRGLRLAGYSPEEGVAREIDAFDFSTDNASDTKLTIQTYQPYDCNGLDTTPTDGLAVNTYELDTTNDLLTCRGNQAKSSNMAVVEGVEDFRVLYGIDDDGDDSTCEPQRYEPYDSGLKSGEVVALRFALLVNSNSAIRTRSKSESFVLLDKKISGNNDRLVREVFNGAVLLRNNTTCTAL